MKRIPILISLAFALSCGTAKVQKQVSVLVQPVVEEKVVDQDLERIASLPLLKIEEDFKAKEPNYTKDALRSWPHQDLFETGFPGMSLEKAYELLKNRKSQKTIVAVIDSGIDIQHEDLKSVIWVNEKEIPNNGIDDDNNGYVDDIHGWNFLGDIDAENLEMVRILKKGDTNNPDYQRALKMYEEEYKEAKDNFKYFNEVYTQLTKVQAYFSQDKYKGLSLNKLRPFAKNSKIKRTFSALMKNMSGHFTIEEAFERIKPAYDHYNSKVNAHLNKNLNVRETILKDNADDFSSKSYGNNNVVGPTADGALHGTHVAGIIGADRTNNIGMQGVANNVAIMAVRAVPDGDEYDKDVALAIRYAVDNGAKVINTSFGKAFSPNVQWVHDAIKYAQEKDVLIVNAAGNETKNIDEEATYPDDNINGVEYVDNMINIGALNYIYGGALVADFSNYGKTNVDLFSPGVEIYATVPNNEYKFLQGTSMASPEVAGLAALIRSYFPNLKANQVKEILKKSGLTPSVKRVMLGNSLFDTQPFENLSSSGKIVNAYNAIIMAAQMSK